MNKKRISKFVLGVGSVLTLVSLAASCSAPIVGNKSTVTPIDKSKIDKKLIFDYKNKSDVLAPLATIDNVIVPQLDNSDDKVVLKKIEWDPADKSSVIVYYVIEDKNSNIKIPETTSKILGFKTEEISEGFPNVTITYKDKSKTISTDAIDKNIIANNLDESKYDFIVKNKKANGNSLTIQYILKDKKSQTESDLKTVTLTGFQNPPEESESLNSVLSKISVSYDNPQGTPINKVSWEKVIFSGVDLSKYSINVLENNIDEDKLSISIVFRIFENGFESNKSDIKKVVISGFGKKSLSKMELQEELLKTTVSYPNKENVFPAAASLKNVTFNGIDTNKVEVVPLEFIPNNKENSALVKFQVKDVNDPKNLSDVRSVAITGFAVNSILSAELTKEIEKTTPTYTNAETTELSAFDIKNINITGFDKNLSKLVINKFEVNDKFNLVIHYQLESIKVPGVKSVEKTSIISGFKRNELNMLLAGDLKGLLKLDSAKINDIIKDLGLPKSEVAFDIINKKVLIQSGPGALKLSDPSTYNQVGVLTDAFKTGRKGWIAQIEQLLQKELTITVKVASLNIPINVFDQIKKFFTSSKGSAKANLALLKRSPGTAEKELKDKVTFDTNWIKSLETLLDSNKYVIAYNPKTGQLVYSLATKQIDFSDASTFTPLLIFKEALRDNVNNKVKELLKTFGIDEKLINILFGDKVTAFYTFEKDRTKTFSGIKLIQK